MGPDQRFPCLLFFHKHFPDNQQKEKRAFTNHKTDEYGIVEVNLLFPTNIKCLHSDPYSRNQL